MKVDKFGTVTLDESSIIKVEGWLFHRDDTDPKDATDGEVLMGFVAPWALQKLQQAVADATLKGLVKHARKSAKPN
jgi:hypothetical protein